MTKKNGSGPIFVPAKITVISGFWFSSASQNIGNRIHIILLLEDIQNMNKITSMIGNVKKKLKDNIKSLFDNFQ